MYPHKTIEKNRFIAKLLHQLDENVDRKEWKDDPYIINENCGWRELSEPEELVNYIKMMVNDNNFTDKAFSLDFINKDNPEYLKEVGVKKLQETYNLPEELAELIYNLQNDEDEFHLDYNEGDSDDVNEFIKDITTSSDYIVIFDDSDGERIWYKKVPNETVLKYVIKNEHRKRIGCGCNQYINMIVKDKQILTDMV
jgi:hypothetical protein